ncbi:MAG: hypothetical protein ACI4WY_08080 [Anaerovoracaceae bacterium]
MDFREWMEKIWEYCQGHWIGLIAAGLVVLILLLSVWLVRLARRDQEEEVSPQELQPESEPMIQPESETEAEPEVDGSTEKMLCEESTAKDEAYALLDILKSMNDRISEECSEKDAESPAETAARGLVTQIIHGAEKAGETAGREVASINLEIEKARLIIRYSDRKEEMQERSEAISSEDKTADPDLREDRQPANQEMKTVSDLSEQQNIPKKFGSDNMNRARSGHVYTEEELRKLIKE